MLVLEPNTGYTKEFTPDEVEDLLDGGPGTRPRLNEDTTGVPVYLKAPDPYPHEMVRSLSLLLEELCAVERVYLVQVVPAEGKGHMGSVASDTAPDGVEIELIFLEGDGKLSRKIATDFEPFFQRAPGG